MRSFAAFVVAGLFWALPASAVTVVNGDFEDVSSSAPGLGLANGNAIGALAGGSGKQSWDVYTKLPGWTTVFGPGIEVQTKNTVGQIDPHSGDYYIELDSHTQPNSDTRMEQNLGFLSEGAYKLSFFYSPRTDSATSNTIDFDVMAGALLFSDSVTRSDGTVGVWTEIVRTFIVPQGGADATLGFAANIDNNTLGGFLDTISLSALPNSVSTVPVPAAMPLLGSALAMLWFAGWRRRMG